MTRTCLTLVCPPAVEEKLLDTLLEQVGEGSFATLRADFHGRTGALTIEEQVRGRSRALQVQVLMEETDAEALLGQLRQGFAGTGLRYWTSPVLNEGVIE